TDYGGKIGEVVMVMGTLALIAMNQRLHGVMILTSMVYQKVGRRALPRKMSLFLETYTPFVIDIGNLVNLQGSLLMQIRSVMSVLTYFDGLKNSMIFSFDAFLRKYLRLSKDTPSLAHIDAPIVMRKNLTFEQMQGILLESNPLEMDYAHCSKVATEQMEKSREFDRFQVLFDTIKWEERYGLIEKKCQDDDRFIDYIVEILGNVAKSKIESNTTHYCALAATKSRKSQQQFIMDWFKAQIPILIDVLMGRKPPEGTQADLDDAIRNCEQILPYLLSRDLTKADEQMEVEDILLALTVEAGGYCATGIKRASSQQLQRAASGFTAAKSEVDGVKIFERRVYQQLEQTRYRIMQKLYIQVAEKFNMNIKITQDIHTLDLYRSGLLGFLPLTQNGRHELGVSNIVGFYIAQLMTGLSIMYQHYRDQYDEDVRGDIGSGEICNYINQMVQENQQLDQSQKEAIMDMYLTRNGNKWDKGSILAPDTDRRFRRLMYVMLGVLKGNF
ncbi:MAG TPA: hypothetical protein VFU89_01810, partial [Rhabdochlamydiaceae bacterium]|nr:hypothetical protein [Rhabdochlamydiaceae bacterium]